MRDESLRWGLGMGVIAAVLGTAALILGSLIEPVNRVTTAEAAALAIFIRGIFVLITLGIALGLAYYAGLRAERERLSADAADVADAADESPSPGAVGTQTQRSVALLAGGLTMFCYWIITSLYLFVLPPSTQPPTAKVDLLSFVENRLLFGVIFVLFGLGLGGLGGRAPAARLLLDRIVKSPLPAPMVAPAATTMPTQSTHEPMEPVSVATRAGTSGAPGVEREHAAAEPAPEIADAGVASPVDARGASDEGA